MKNVRNTKIKKNGNKMFSNEKTIKYKNFELIVQNKFTVT